MISTFDLVPRFSSVCPTFGDECAEVLCQRSFIAESHKDEVAEVISHFPDSAESATLELIRRGLIVKQNETIASEFIRRTTRRALLKANGLSGDALGRILGMDRQRARRVMNGTHSLSANNIKLLMEKWPGTKGLSSM